MLVPAEVKTPKRFNAEEHMRWLKETWGDRVFSAGEVEAMREAELEGEEG